MNIINVNVPEGIRYISQWKNFKIPKEQNIIDKKVCGCGFTEYCLNNNEDTILCSPRISLLESKIIDNPQCFLVQNTKIPDKKEQLKLGIKTSIDLNKYLFNILTENIKKYYYNRKKLNLPIKFMVTYDSFPKLCSILEILGLSSKTFRIIIDEFQLIFTDSKFKADTELDFITYLRQNPYVTFLSATPMVENYLDYLDEFKNLNYYIFNWGDRVIHDIVNSIKVNNLEQIALEIINLYKQGMGPVKEINGVLYKSTEAVFYLNNVSIITSIIKKAKLKPEEVNIIASKYNNNNTKIKKCGKGFEIGTAPKNNKPHKMFTFCTSTAYCGMDFYSKSAKSYVFSNCNINSLSLDIIIELPQIAGRQRRDDNPFKDDITFFYTTSMEEYSREDLESNILRKCKNTQYSINTYNRIPVTNSEERNHYIDKLKKVVYYDNYTEDYTGIDKLTGLPIENKLVILAERRAWELKNEIYNNRINVFKSFPESMSVKGSDNYQILEKILSNTYFEDRIRDIVYQLKLNPDFINIIPSNYRVYFDNISLDEIIRLNYMKNNLDRYLQKKSENSDIDNSSLLREKIYSVFKEGNSYTKKELKQGLSEIYLTLFSNLKQVIKSNEIEKYFEVKRARIKDILDDGSIKYDEGFYLVKKKNIWN